MSRVAKQPVIIPKGVEVSINQQLVTVKGPMGNLAQQINDSVLIESANDTVVVKPKKENKDFYAQAGTARSLINNMVYGVSNGFEKTLELVGVGYRAKVQGNVIDLTLGFSHPVKYSLMDGVTAETPSNTVIVIKGVDKQKVGQVAAEIRQLRPPEPYKGKGVRYAGEMIVRKETKKK